MMFLHTLRLTSIFLLILIESQSYDMTPLTIKPVPKPSDDDVRNEVIEFESLRSSSLFPVEVTLRIEDTVDLCNAITTDKEFGIAADLAGKRIVSFVPVVTAEGFKDPIFTRPCFGWMRKACVGTPKPPFDYRCHFWVPYFVSLPGEKCNNDKTTVPVLVQFIQLQTGHLERKLFVLSFRRKKRVAYLIESVVVNGFEAATLCATMGRLAPWSSVVLEQVALPSNEGSNLRCINWWLSPEGGWVKRMLSKDGCNKINKRRPESYVVSPDGDNDGYDDIINCNARGTLVDCVFVDDQPKVSK